MATLIRNGGGNTVRKAAKQWYRVEPVVKMSSISSIWEMRSCSIPPPAENELMQNAPLTFASFSSADNSVWVRVRLFLIMMSVFSSAPSCSATSFATISAWLYPRFHCLDQWRGTGITMSTSEKCSADASLLPRILPKCRPAWMSPLYLMLYWMFLYSEPLWKKNSAAANAYGSRGC